MIRCNVMTKYVKNLFFLFKIICIGHCFILFVPSVGWTQALSDTGTFAFTGNQNPIRNAPRLGEFLPGDGVKAGPIKVHPFLGLAEVYTDNVFRTKKNREDGILTTIAPGIQALYPFAGRHSMLLDYRATQFLYPRFSENNALAQNGLGHLVLDFPGGLNFHFQGNHVEGFDPRGSDLDSQQDDITKWRSNWFQTRTEYFGPSFGIGLGFSYGRLHFKNNNQDAPRDRKNINSNLTFFLPVNPTSYALLQFNISDQNFDENNQLDSFSYGVSTGFRLAASRQLSGQINVGYSILNFDRAPEGRTAQVQELQQEGLSLGGQQQEALSLAGALRWRPTSRFQMSLVPFRTIQQSAVFNTSTFIQSGVRLRVRKEFQKGLGVRGSFLYSNSDFEEGREDNRFRWRAALDYRTVQWLGFQLSYAFERRNSNQSAFDFYSNTIMISVQGLL